MSIFCGSENEIDGESPGWGLTATLKSPGALILGRNGELLVGCHPNVVAIYADGYCETKMSLPSKGSFSTLIEGPDSLYFTSILHHSFAIQKQDEDAVMLIGNQGQCKLSSLGEFWNRVLHALLPNPKSQFCHIIVEGDTIYKPEFEKVVLITPETKAKDLISGIPASDVPLSPILLAPQDHSPIQEDTRILPLIQDFVSSKQWTAPEALWRIQQQDLYPSDLRGKHMPPLIPTIVLTSIRSHECYVNFYEFGACISHTITIEGGLSFLKLQRAIAEAEQFKSKNLPIQSQVLERRFRQRMYGACGGDDPAYPLHYNVDLYKVTPFPIRWQITHQEPAREMLVHPSQSIFCSSKEDCGDFEV